VKPLTTDQIRCLLGADLEKIASEAVFKVVIDEVSDALANEMTSSQRAVLDLKVDEVWKLIDKHRGELSDSQMPVYLNRLKIRFDAVWKAFHQLGVVIADKVRKDVS
jgi:hypothetical protein